MNIHQVVVAVLVCVAIAGLKGFGAHTGSMSEVGG
jgi:hypothetical protein